MTEPETVRIDETEVFITRMFAAPRDVVFRFFTEGPALASWFGPDSWTNPVEDCVVEPRLGGAWRIRMVSLDATQESTLEGVITVFEPPAILGLEMTVPTPVGVPAMIIRLRIELHDHGDRTRMTFHQGPFPNTTAIEQTIAGWRQSWAVLDTHLDGLARSSSAPR
ncbi:SRPBCC domain-containing protein [Microbacteriaceae bacterium VKM Ac-2855]|nr:SRPBCC domain-containing protein [Microbacteriaceae bacterium VKM Ac-2855]